MHQQPQPPLQYAHQSSPMLPTNPPTSERADGTHSTPPPYRSPPPQAREVSGLSAPNARPLYETDAIHRVELDSGVQK